MKNVVAWHAMFCMVKQVLKIINTEKSSYFREVIGKIPDNVEPLTGCLRNQGIERNEDKELTIE